LQLPSNTKKTSAAERLFGGKINLPNSATNTTPVMKAKTSSLNKVMADSFSAGTPTYMIFNTFQEYVFPRMRAE